MLYFNIKQSKDSLIISTKEWTSTSADSTNTKNLEDLKKVYGKKIQDPASIVKIALYGLSSNMGIKHQYVQISETESHKITYLQIHDDLPEVILSSPNKNLYGRHLRAILELICPSFKIPTIPVSSFSDPSTLEAHSNVSDNTSNSLSECEEEERSYTICLPDHFEAFDKHNKLIPTEIVLSKLEDKHNFDTKNSSLLLMVGQSYDEEFKNPIKILGLTQIKLCFK